MKVTKQEPLPNFPVKDITAQIAYARKNWRRVHEMPTKVADLVGRFIDCLIEGADSDSDLTKKLEKASEDWKQAIIEQALSTPTRPTRRNRSRSDGDAPRSRGKGGKE